MENSQKHESIGNSPDNFLLKETKNCLLSCSIELLENSLISCRKFHILKLSLLRLFMIGLRKYEQWKQGCKFYGDRD